MSFWIFYFIIINMSKYFFLLVILIFSTPVFAIQENQKINLEDAINLVLKTNPQLALAKMDIDIARNDILSANRFQNPSLSTNQQLPSYGSDDPQIIEASLLIEILKRGKRKETKKAYSLSVIDSEKFLEQALKAEVKKAYIDLLIKKTNLKLLGEMEELSRELYKTSVEDAKKGNIAEPDVIQAKIALNRAIMYKNIAKSDVVYSQNRLNAVLNSSNINYDTKEDFLTDDYKALLTIDPIQNIPAFENIYDYAIKNRFDLSMAQKNVTTAKKKLEEVKSYRIPDLELGGGYAYFSKGMNDGKWQDGAFIKASIQNIPILYNFKPEIKNAEIEVQQAELRYEDMKIDVQRNLMDAWERFLIARDNLNFYNKEILADSKNLMDASIKGLNDKQVDLTAFFVSKRLYLELMQAYLETLGEYYISYAELLKELNTDSLNIENSL